MLVVVACPRSSPKAEHSKGEPIATMTSPTGPVQRVLYDIERTFL